VILFPTMRPEEGQEGAGGSGGSVEAGEPE